MAVTQDWEKGSPQEYDLRSPQGGLPLSIGVVIHQPSGLPGRQHVWDDTTCKRELRLLKNREAAKECRRRKKEYVKCLENRVSVLENQNKQLIEELQALKEAYCSKGE
uniref:cAMP-responsive element modulator-like n=1 Tax=Myxine glutinosa TaxID=7769 RepID=UPI00358E29E6